MGAGFDQHSYLEDLDEDIMMPLPPHNPMTIRETILPLERHSIERGRSERYTEVTRVQFRPLWLVLHDPDPDLYLTDIIIDNFLVFAGTGAVPARMFAQTIEKEHRINLNMPTLHHGSRITIKYDYMGTRVIFSEGVLIGLCAK